MLCPGQQYDTALGMMRCCNFIDTPALLRSRGFVSSLCCMPVYCSAFQVCEHGLLSGAEKYFDYFAEFRSLGAKIP